MGSAPGDLSRRPARLLLLLALIWVLFAAGVFANDSAHNQIEIRSGSRVLWIAFIGNKSFTAMELGNVIGADEPDLWFDKFGGLDAHRLAEAGDTLAAFFYDHGFLNVAVDEPQTAPGNRVAIAINEGPLYRVGSLALKGQLEFPRSEVQSTLKLKSGESFRGSRLLRDVIGLSDFYSDRGYAFVSIDPRTKMDAHRHIVDVNFFITPGHQIRIGRITIKGIDASRKWQIREALLIQPHQLYSARSIRESEERIKDLEFVKRVDIGTKASSEPNEVDIELVVAE